MEIVRKNAAPHLVSFLKELTDRTRTDVIALYKPYSPKPPEGKKQGSYNPRRAPLTDADLQRHLNGEQPLGVYLLDPATPGRVRLAVVDVDDKKKEHPFERLVGFSDKIKDQLQAHGLLPWACRSSSGHGVHLWLLWNEPQDAAQVRALLKELVTKAEVPVHVDLFPGNVQGAEELGTLVALPLARASRPLYLSNAQVTEDLDAWLPASPALSAPVLPVKPSLEPGKRAAGIYGPVDVETLSEALSFIPSEEYETWIRVGMALKRAVADGQLQEADAQGSWERWAAASPKFNPKEQAYQWRHLRPSGELTLGTVWHLAETGGWRPPASELVSEADAAEVSELNQDHFLCEEGGRVFIFREDVDEVLERPVLTRLNAGDFKLKHLNNKVLLGHNKKGAPVLKDLGSVWLGSPKRRQYDKIVLRPEGAPANHYNLWRGWSVQPAEAGSCALLKDHLLNIICGGDAAAYSYLWRWCALTVQRPQEPIGTAVVLRGGRGTGKGTFVRALGDLFGHHYLQIFSSRDLTGRFNSHLRDCLLMFADEAVWAGSKQEQAVLQGIITEPYLLIEGKGRDHVQVRNMLHLIIATNNQWSVPAGLDERRFLALNVSDDQKQNLEYFQKIKDELKAGGRARLLWELLREDLTEFNVFEVPQTQELMKQKLLSLDPWAEWWYEKLLAGSLLRQFSGWEDETPFKALYLDYVQHCRLTGHRMIRSPEHLGRCLRELLPAEPRASYQRLKIDLQYGREELKMGEVMRFWVLPPLSSCREFFAQKSKSKLEWDDFKEAFEAQKSMLDDDRPLL